MDRAERKYAEIGETLAAGAVAGAAVAGDKIDEDAAVA